MIRTPAIDVHGHFGPYVIDENLLHGQWWSQTPEVVKQRARAVGVRLTVLSPLKGMMPEGKADPIQGNEDAARAVADDPELLFWAVLDPTTSGSFEQVGELLDHPKCAGIKIHPTLHHYEIEEKGDEVFRFAAEHSALVLSHSGCPRAFPERFIPFTNAYPEARLILAHLGNDAEGSSDRQVRAVQQCRTPNVWVDTSSSNSMLAGLIEWAVDQLGGDRIVFGSDTPLHSVASQKARIDHAEMSADDKRMVLWDNAVGLLGERALDGQVM